MTTEDLVTIAGFANSQEANMAKAALEDDGINSYLLGVDSSTTFGTYVGTAQGGVKLQVSSRDEDRARSLLEKVRDREALNSTPAWMCPQCGEVVDAGFEVCWSCGAIHDEAAREPSETTPPSDNRLDLELEELPESLIEDSVEEMASKALRAAIYGMVLFPFSFYSLSLLVRISSRELNGAALNKFYRATVIDIFMLFIWTMVIMEFSR